VSLPRNPLTREVTIGSVRFGGELPPALIAGPCVVEDEQTPLRIANRLVKIAKNAGWPIVFKASYDKANRTSVDSFRGIGMQEGLAVLACIWQETGLPVLSDVHSVEQIEASAGILDCLQIPAFLCRQTDLLLAAGQTGKAVNVKKGQFLAPGQVGNILDKVKSTGNENVCLTERGVSFGYGNLVTDFRAIPQMQKFGHPVVFDGTHSVQQPGGLGTKSGGDREMVPYLVRAAAAAGADAFFLEVHEDPEKALSDGPNMLYLDDVEALLNEISAIRQALGKA
jgi:2-dehydro-3-deoxyphosphooctonate aldolase (KDO 8-P synthase)